MKKLAVLMAAVMLLTMGAGCGKKEKTDGKVQITVGSWPGESASDATKENYENYLKAMNTKYPNIEIKKDMSEYDHKSFTIKASSHQLPTVYKTNYTEFQKIVNQGYAADITEQMKKNGYADALNPIMKDFISSDGKYYAIPVQSGAYALGLACNKNLFEKAGLVNEDGSIKAPSTYDELVEYSKIIKEKTGAYGIALPTMNNEGGWFFSMIAWAYGTDFITEENGNYKASFDTKECRNALGLYQDLRWKYNVIPNNAFVSRDDARKLFATDQAAMYFDAQPSKTLTTKYNMDKNNLIFVRVPAGKAGRMSLMGGAIYMINPDATPEQIDAVFKWVDICGEGPIMTEDGIKSFEASLQADVRDNAIVTDRDAFSVWTNEELTNKRNELRAKYTNVDSSHIADYCSFEDVTVRKEEYPCCQQLYSVLDEGIQLVLSKKDVNVTDVVKDMAHKFQVNHLDKWEE